MGCEWLGHSSFPGWSIGDVATTCTLFSSIDCVWATKLEWPGTLGHQTEQQPLKDTCILSRLCLRCDSNFAKLLTFWGSFVIAAYYVYIKKMEVRRGFFWGSCPSVIGCSFPCSQGEGQVGASLSLVSKETLLGAWPIHPGAVKHRDCGIQRRKSEIKHCVPLEAGCSGYTSRVCQGKNGWDEVWTRWRRADLEVPSRDFTKVATYEASGPNRAVLCLVGCGGQGLRTEPKAASWRRQCLPSASEISV